MVEEIFKSFKEFIGILISFEFAVVIFILTTNQNKEFNYWSIMAIFWLIISIMCGLECIMGYLGFEQKGHNIEKIEKIIKEINNIVKIRNFIEKLKDEKKRKKRFRAKGKYFWYLTMYSFYISIIYLLCANTLFLLSLIVYYILFFNICCFWISHFYINVKKNYWKILITIFTYLVFIIFPLLLGFLIFDEINENLILFQIFFSIFIIVLATCIIINQFNKKV